MIENYNMIITEDSNGTFVAYLEENPSAICVAEKKEELLGYLEKGMGVLVGNKNDLFEIWLSPDKKSKCLVPVYVDNLPPYYVWKCCQILNIPVPEECENADKKIKRTWKRAISMTKLFVN